MNIQNWYWKADDGRIYASASQSLVSSTDAGYVLFCRANTPSTWPKDGVGAQTSASLQDVLEPYGLCADLKYYAAAKRYAKEIGGTTISGVAYPTDRDTQSKLTAAALFSQVDGTRTFKWKLADGTFTPTITAAQMIALASAVGAFVNSCFLTEQTVAAGIDAGTITTQAQVDSAFT